MITVYADREDLPAGSPLDYLNRWQECSSRHYGRIPFVYEHAKDCRLWTIDGREYIDATSGYSAVNLGHHNPCIMNAVAAFFAEQRPFVVPNKVATTSLVDMLSMITRYSGYQKFIPMNSGAEAVETALKLALKWGYTVKKIPEGKAFIIACENNFHGRTRSTVMLSTNAAFKTPFGPYPDMVDWVPFGDAMALERTLAAHLECGGDRVAAFIVEPIQGEAGFILPPPGYLEAVKAICKKYNVLFIADEIQTALGRAGKKLVSEDVHPDLVTVGKSLGGGIVPLSGVLLDAKHAVFEPGEHGSTYAGNAFASTIACAVIAEMERMDAPKRSREMGNYLMYGLRKTLEGNPRVKEIRGQGLMIAIEFTDGNEPHDMAMRCIAHGVLTIGGKVAIRVCPPLTIDCATCDELAVRIAHALKSN